MMCWEGWDRDAAVSLVAPAVETHRHALLPHIKDQDPELSAQSLQQPLQVLLLKMKPRKKIWKNEDVGSENLKFFFTCLIRRALHICCLD